MSLLFGLAAALAWATHDICIRFVSSRIRILSALLTVLVVGLAASLPVALLWGDWGAMTPRAGALSAIAGLFFAMASIALYHAFSIGPVRLVSPIIAAYPALSVAVRGFPVQPLQALAVFVIIVGVGLAAALSDDAGGGARKDRAIVYSLLSSVGFFGTFAFGQEAARSGAELPSILILRVAAVAAVAALLVARREARMPDRSILPLLCLLGLLDAGALGLVTAAGSLPHPEFAAVAASLFGMLTVILARVVLKEPMTMPQWCAVAVVFCGIGYLAA